ncbi:MAG: glutaredoxin family protein, partial [Burkholderiales bacterium]|nr:glutaredoxin family protein [Burkholderiales bacterium]
MNLVLYIRADCHLCEEMRAELEPWRSKLGFDLQVVDISNDPTLVTRYGGKVPVLAH